jgi:hypothetical protein
LHRIDFKDAALYATREWEFLTNLATFNKRKDIYFERKGENWVFDNAVITDGVSISFQVTPESCFKRKEMFKKKTVAIDEEDVASKKETRKKQKGSCCGSGCTHTFLTNSSQKGISTDPGKCDILAFSDGFNNLRYTNGMRKQDTHQHVFKKETLRLRKKGNIDQLECEQLSQMSSKSCLLDAFISYVRMKFQNQIAFKKVYEKPYFRERKFTSWSTTESSEMKFARKVETVFCPAKTTNTRKLKRGWVPEALTLNAAKAVTRDNLVIAWGNWGRNPNALKNGAPTPGIGIRRSFERFFKTETIDEHLTSQTCPDCRVRSLENRCRRHHLLHCINAECPRSWWNRNVVGSYNILYNALCNPETLIG